MRQAGVAKMGYIRTPDSEVQKIVSMLSLGEEQAVYRLLDPCAGEGLALRDTKKALQAQRNNHQVLLSYGIELDQARAAEAEEVLDHVVACAYETSRTIKEAYSLLWLNPPYDHEAVSDNMDDIRNRKELTFLRGTVPYMAKDSILVYIIPQHRLNEQIATTLGWRFEDFAVFRFSDGEYEAYKQIVVICKRKRKSGINTAEEKAAFKYLVEVGKEQVDVPVLGDTAFADRQWIVPPSPIEEKDFQFRGSMLDPIELAKDLEKSSVWKNTMPLITLLNQKVTGGQPLLPLKTAHLGTVIAAGAIDGVIGQGDDRHMIVGLTRKVVDKEEEYDEKGKTEVNTERFKSAVKVYTPHGVIKELS